MVKLPCWDRTKPCRTLLRPGESDDGPGRADVEGVGALEGTRARARRVKGGNRLRGQWDGYASATRMVAPALAGVSFLRKRMFSYPLKQQRAGKRLILRQNFAHLSSGRFV